MSLAQNVCLDDFLVEFETESPGQIEEYLVNTLEVLFLKQSS